MSVSLRGTGIQASSAASYTVSWPTGTVAGDFAVIFAAGGWFPSTPAGWNVVPNTSISASNWQGAAFYKQLTSADVTAGSVSVSFSGTFDAVVAIVTIQGNAFIWASTAGQGASGVSTASLSAAANVSAGLGIYFGSNRAASTDTVSRGSLQRTVNDGASGSGCLYSESGVFGTVNPTYSYGTPGSGHYEVLVVLDVVPVVNSEVISTPMSNAGSGAKHQIVQPPVPNFPPAHYNPVPVASALKNGTTGTAYSETITAQGGSSPYTFAVTSGALPTGTTLNSSSGVISGTPSAASTFSFTITVTDSLGFTGSQAFTIATAAPSAGGGAFTFIN